MKTITRIAIVLFVLLSALSPAWASAEHAEQHQALLSRAPHVETARFRFFGESDVHTTLERLSKVAESRFDALCTPLGACDFIPGKIDVWVAYDAHDFALSFPNESPMAEWAAGVAFLKSNRIVLRTHGTSMFSFMETFDHELAHLLHHAFVPEGRLPRWFSEGFAIWQSGENVVDRIGSALRAAAAGKLLTLDEADRAFPSSGTRVETAYAQSALFVHHLVKAHGAQSLIATLHDVRAGKDFNEAFFAQTGQRLEDAFEVFDEALTAKSNPFVFLMDGSWMWGLSTVLFLWVALKQRRERKVQMAALDKADADKIAREDFELFLEHEQRRLGVSEREHLLN